MNKIKSIVISFIIFVCVESLIIINGSSWHTIEVATTEELVSFQDLYTVSEDEQPIQTVYISDWIDASVTGYCSCSICCGAYATGNTASGTHVTEGRTMAAPKEYPFGTQIEVEGLGIFIVEDRGSAIYGNKFDIYFDTHQKASDFGRQKRRIRIIS